MERRQQSDLQQPLLQQSNNIQEEAILQEWNASVAAFVADDGGDENQSCYCDSIDPEGNSFLASEGAEDVNEQEDPVVDNSRCSVLLEKLATICTSTMLPDVAPTLKVSSVDHDDDNEDTTNLNSAAAAREEEPREQAQCIQLVESVGVIKFLKFALLTIGSIALVRKTVVALGISDRDTSLTLSEIVRYEGDSILRDLVVFFVVGRMYQRTGVDTIEWIGFGLLANLYFESQAYIPWMQHSVTPYEMHCLWPWQLWIFAGLVVVGAMGIIMAHIWVAHHQRRLWIVAGEFLVCVGVFVGPKITSPYAHFHHWFAGWLLGMHANLPNHWWSRATMAWCWGTMVNGIAVYGRDPVLTCDYARFLALDQNCPFDFSSV